MRTFWKILISCLFLLLPMLAWAEDALPVRELPLWKSDKNISSLSANERADHLLGLTSSFYESIDSPANRRAWLTDSVCLLILIDPLRTTEIL